MRQSGRPRRNLLLAWILWALQSDALCIVCCLVPSQVNLILRGGYQTSNGYFGGEDARALPKHIEQILAYGDEDRYPPIIDEDGYAYEGGVMYQTPTRILDYDSWIQEASPRIALKRLLKAARIGEDDEIRLMVAYLKADVNGFDPHLQFTVPHASSTSFTH